jgi:hypothetical protein
MEVTDRIAASYRRFATTEAAGRSAVYADIALRVSRDGEVLALLAGLPPPKRQPNLLLGAVQYLHGPLDGWDAFRSVLASRTEDVMRVVLARRTQTNIPARCATLLPALAALPQPLALLEVGASAGLCLYPDRYAYDYGGHRIAPAPGGAAAPVLRCSADAATPLPDGPVEVVWRAGLDLDPLDVTDADDVAWLDALVWPGEEHLRAQLHAAAAIARADPPLLTVGDLRTDLVRLVESAPAAATLVVMHTAVLAYVADAADRERFAETVLSSRATWIANEVPARIPGVRTAVPDGAFLLCRDGRPLAVTDPHGSSIRWLGEG